MTQGRKELAATIERFARYVKRKTMELSGEKSKVMVFERGEGRRKKTEWRLVGEKKRRLGKLNIWVFSYRGTEE